jgi:hypothetical protein
LLLLFDFFTPVPGVAGVCHSGGDPEPGEDVFLQGHPENEKCQQQQYLFQNNSSIIDLLHASDAEPASLIRTFNRR